MLELGAHKTRRFTAEARCPRGRMQAQRAAAGAGLGAKRAKKGACCGMHYVMAAGERRVALRPHVRSARCIMHSLPEPRQYVADAVRASMKGNKGKDTKPEMLVRRRLRMEGLVGYRLQWRVPGRPDIAFPGKKVAIFVNGCFWHRCPHCNPSTPKTNQEYWVPKFRRNQERDKENHELLRSQGWRVHVIWECQLKKKSVEHTFSKLIPLLKEELAETAR